MVNKDSRFKNQPYVKKQLGQSTHFFACWYKLKETER